MILTTPEQIARYQLLSIRTGLKLEALGMRHSKNAVFNAAKKITGKKTRLQCLEALNEMINK